MSKRSQAIDLKKKFEEERNQFPAELLNVLSSYPIQDIETICKEEFGDTDVAAQVHWQAIITRAHRSPADFAEIASAGSWERAPHFELLNDVFVDACYNRRFIIVSLPVRHGKSEFISKWAPAWYLSKFPDRKIMQVSYAKRVAQSFSQGVRNIVEETSGDFFGLTLEQSAADKFGFYQHAGELYSTGVSGQSIGMGGHLIIMDDAYKDIHQAYSPQYNKKLREWWSGTLRHRVEPGGSMIVVLARWTPTDLAGWLIEEAQQVAGMESWTEIKLPAIWEEDTPDPILGRTKGGFLWPGRYSEEEMYQLKASVGRLTWQAQFQQDPKSVSNSMFPVNSWETVSVKDLPKLEHTVRYWDLSAGGERSDYVCGVLMGVDSAGSYYVLDVAREKFIGEDADLAIQEFVKETSKADFRKNSDTKFWFEEVPGAGKAVSANYKRTVFKGLPAEAHRKQGNKVSNAQGFASQQQGRNVFLAVRDKWDEKEDGYRTWYVDNFDWAEPYIDELASFPVDSTNDDQVDASSGAHQKLEELFFEHGGRPARFVNPVSELETDSESGLDVNKILTQGISSQTKAADPARKTRARIYRARDRNTESRISQHYGSRYTNR